MFLNVKIATRYKKAQGHFVSSVNRTLEIAIMLGSFIVIRIKDGKEQRLLAERWWLCPSSMASITTRLSTDPFMVRGATSGASLSGECCTRRRSCLQKWSESVPTKVLLTSKSSFSTSTFYSFLSDSSDETSCCLHLLWMSRFYLSATP